MKIYCCECQCDIEARLTNGQEVYSHRKDLYNIPFWICDACKNFVGCHYKTKSPTTPLGVISNKIMKQFKIKIHNILDPMWKTQKISRGKIYTDLSRYLGYVYHTGEIKTITEAEKIYNYLCERSKQLTIKN
jgi:predicted DNA-binding transcriptional regulator